jgi:hypothetical protein
VLSQWRSGGVAEAAALEDLADYGVTSILRTPLPERAAFRRMSFDSKGLTSGPIGHTIDSLIADLIAPGALDELVQLAQEGEP